MTGLASPQVLHPGWYVEEVLPGVDAAEPGVYEWRIEGVGCYIGQYTRQRRPRREYGLNVGRLLTGRPYRKNKPGGFRQIHRELTQAVRDRRKITRIFVENQLVKIDRNRRERELIADRRLAATQDGLPVLNGG